MDGDLARNEAREAESAEDQARLLKLLGNPWRLRMLCLLATSPRQVSDIEEVLGLGQAYVSQQLARLRLEGIVEGERSGRTVLYRIVDERVEPVLKAICR